MTIACPKCHTAGLIWFERRTVWPQVGPALDVIACRNCGNWLKSRPVEARTIPAPTPAALKKGANRTLQERIREHIEAHTLPCSIAGCSGTYYAQRARLPLCRTHRKRLVSWEHNRDRRGSLVGPPPVALVNGVWIERGQPLPGIPGEKPVCAESPAKPQLAKKSKSHGRTAQRGGQKPCRKSASPPEPERLAGLRQLAKLGNPSARALLARLEL